MKINVWEKELTPVRYTTERIKALESYLQNFNQTLAEGKNLVICEDTEVGKTYLMHGIALDLGKQGFNTVHMSAHDIILALMNGYCPNDLLSFDAMVIDDVEVLHKDHFPTFLEAISYRCKHKRPCILSCNVGFFFKNMDDVSAVFEPELWKTLTVDNGMLVTMLDDTSCRMRTPQN